MVASIGDNYKHQEMARVLICVDIFEYQICWKAVWASVSGQGISVVLCYYAKGKH